MIGGVGNINGHCVFFDNISMSAQYSIDAFDSWIVFVTNTERGLFDLVLLFINRSCLSIDSVSKAMLSISNSEYPLEMSRFLICKINCLAFTLDKSFECTIRMR